MSKCHRLPSCSYYWDLRKKFRCKLTSIMRSRKGNLLAFVDCFLLRLIFKLCLIVASPFHWTIRIFAGYWKNAKSLWFYLWGQGWRCSHDVGAFIALSLVEMIYAFCFGARERPSRTSRLAQKWFQKGDEDDAQKKILFWLFLQWVRAIGLLLAKCIFIFWMSLWARD